MHCDFCNKPAVVHETTVRNGVKKEVHLCEEHAAESGIAMPGHQPINQILTQYVISHPSNDSDPNQGTAARQAGVSRKTCPDCGMTYARFRKTGILGCASCYDAFGDQLAPLIERAQNAGTHHTGKAPRRSGKSIDQQLLRQRLIRQLDEAVEAEQYERAAKIRDMLNGLAPCDLSPEPVKTRRDKSGG
jgi:protein arginine kinase activator